MYFKKINHQKFLIFSCVHATLHLALSVGWFVTLYFFFYDFYFWTSLLWLIWSSDFKYGPCPPARDFGSRVSGLVYFKIRIGPAIQFLGTSNNVLRNCLTQRVVKKKVTKLELFSISLKFFL